MRDEVSYHEINALLLADFHLDEGLFARIQLSS